MICLIMGIKDSVNMSYARIQHLFTEVRRCIDQQAGIALFYHDTGAAAAVLGGDRSGVAGDCDGDEFTRCGARDVAGVSGGGRGVYGKGDEHGGRRVTLEPWQWALGVLAALLALGLVRGGGRRWLARRPPSRARARRRRPRRRRASVPRRASRWRLQARASPASMSQRIPTGSDT